MASVSARIRVEIEVEVGKWDGKATFDDLKSKVESEGYQIAKRMFERREILEPPTGWVIPGTAKVLFVMMSEER